MSDWLKELKVGDKVCVHSWSWYSESYKTGKVEKITPSGLIKVNGSLFYPDTGKIRGDVRCTILNPKDGEVAERLKKFKEEQYIKTFMYRFASIPPDSLNIEQVKKIEEILGWNEGKANERG